jgi:hypothetical protein
MFPEPAISSRRGSSMESARVSASSMSGALVAASPVVTPRPSPASSRTRKTSASLSGSGSIDAANW